MSTAYTVHAFGVCPAANRDAVNNRITRMRPADGLPYGDNNFSVPLNAAGDSSAATHYCTHWVMSAAQFSQLSGDSVLQSLGVVWDATRGKVGDVVDGATRDRESEFLRSVNKRRTT